jgi:hypothetical protein
MTSIPISMRRGLAWVALATVAGLSVLVIVAAWPRSGTEPASLGVRAAGSEFGAFTGRVVWPDGKSAGGARVTIVPLRSDHGSSETVADEEGVFRFVGFSTQGCAITARVLDTRGPLPRITAIGHVEPVHPSAPPCDVALARLLPIRGTVVDTANLPLRSVHVQVTGSSVLLPFVPRDDRDTEEDGRFEVFAPEGAPVTLEGIRRSFFEDIVTEFGPTGRWTGMPGSEGVVLPMPDER